MELWRIKSEDRAKIIPDVSRTKFRLQRLRYHLQRLPRTHRCEHQDNSGRLDHRTVPVLRRAAALPAAGNLPGQALPQIRNAAGAPWGLKSAATTNARTGPNSGHLFSLPAV